MHKLSFYKYFLSIERYLRIPGYCTIREGYDFNLIKRNICSKAQNTIHSFRQGKEFSPIFSNDDLKILKDLGNYEKIITCPPDKSRGVVVMNKAGYVNKMDAILADSTKFQKMPNVDPIIVTVHLEDRINRLLSKLKSLGTISEERYKYLCAAGTAPDILYGLAKPARHPAPSYIGCFKAAMSKIG